jgi:hypothetical protein
VLDADELQPPDDAAEAVSLREEHLPRHGNKVAAPARATGKVASKKAARPGHSVVQGRKAAAKSKVKRERGKAASKRRR